MKVEWLVALLVSLALNAGGLFMITGYRGQVDDLLTQLKNQPVPEKPVVKDCQLTPWCNNDGSITVMVNGWYSHVLRCGGL